MLNANYIVGLVDGEGSFTVFIRNPNNKVNVKRRVIAEPKFYLKLIEKDKKILYELQQFFGCGKVYFQKDNRPNHQHCYRYEVVKREDLEKIIIPFFERHSLKTKKNLDFIKFRKVLMLMDRKEHLTAQGIKKIKEIASIMNRGCEDKVQPC